MKLKFICFLILMSAISAYAKEQKPHLSVSGFATVYKPADQVSLSVGVVTDAERAQNALQANSEAMQLVIQALQAKQLTDKEYATGQFSISPVYDSPPREPSPTWTPKIIGYQVNNTVTVHTDKIALVGEIIDAVNQAGANAIDHIQFELKDKQPHHHEVIKLATENAMQDAKNLAASANLKLGKIREIALNSQRAHEPMYKMAALAERSTPIQAGDVAISADVSVIFDLDHSP